MTTGARHGTDFICSRCGASNEIGDNFCGACRASLPHPPPPPPPAPRPPTEDGTTRYLCAATHLDPVFADRAITEYLTEDVRAIPPSPGLNTAAVLREAVAARTRREIRDGLLLLLLLVFAIFNVALFVLWLLLAVGAVVATATAPDSRRGRSRRFVTIAAVGIVALVAFFLLPRLVFGLAVVPGIAGFNAAAAVLLLLISSVVAVDAVAVHLLVREAFRRGRFQADVEALDPGWEKTVRSLGLRGRARALARVDAAQRSRVAARSADVIVHRGVRPFVGAGHTLQPVTIALPLEPASDTAATRPVDVLELHDHLSAAVLALKPSSKLTPGGRLATLTDRSQILIPADDLVRNVGAIPGVLDAFDAAPCLTVPEGLATALAQRPMEWARYYRCYSVETWDRDLGVSCYVHVGTDERMLYLEWTHCVLAPLRPRYRAIDERPTAGEGQLTRAILDLLQLPATVPDRVRSLLGGPAPLRERAGEVRPDRYGADRTIRELAADTDIRVYFQQLDALRYVNILQSCLTRAVGNFLDERGYSVVEFQRVATGPITLNSVSVSGGNFFGSAVGAGTVTATNRTQ